MHAQFWLRKNNCMKKKKNCLHCHSYCSCIMNLLRFIEQKIFDCRKVVQISMLLQQTQKLIHPSRKICKKMFLYMFKIHTILHPVFPPDEIFIPPLRMSSIFDKNISQIFLSIFKSYWYNTE